MQKPKVNYLIAACAHRRENASDCIEPTKILRHHLEELLKTDLSLLTQVTVLQALPLNRIGEEHSNQYWDIQDLLDKIPCTVELLPLEGGAFSYGLWVQACKHYDASFDYYILIEDDYYPSHPNFVEILLNEHKEKLPEGGYLSSFVTDHAAISNGIVDASTFKKVISGYPDIMSYLNQAAQVNFSLMFEDKIDDYTDKYRSLFNVDLIECSHYADLNNEIDIFNPIQYIVKQKPSTTHKCVVQKVLKGRDLLIGFKKLGIKENQQIMVHSALSSFGQLSGGAVTFIKCLQDIITSNGLITMPVFTYGKEPFDKYQTPSKTGKITEMFRLTKDVLRSDHPTHSLCAWGKNAEEFVKGHKTESAFCVESPFNKFYKDGYILLVGVDYTSCSLIHLGQELANVDYLDRPKFVEVVNKDKTISQFKVRRAGCSVGFNNIKTFIDPDQVKVTLVGNSLLTFVPANIVVNAAIKMLIEDQGSLFCTNPNCFACNEARKMLAS